MKKSKTLLIFMMVIMITLSISGCKKANVKKTQDGFDTSTIHNQYLDIPYGIISQKQKLDIYLPNEGKGPYPVIVAIHGGAFAAGDKTRGAVMSMIEGVARGYAVVCINYRLSGEAVFPAAISDAKAAVRFLKANATTYHLNAEKIAVWGNSAGGNLASLVGVTGNENLLNGDNRNHLEHSSGVNAVIDWFAPIDFPTIDRQFEENGLTSALGVINTADSPLSQYLGGNVAERLELSNQTNPQTYITKDDPPFFVQHGNLDNTVPLMQSIDFVQTLRAVLGNEKVKFEILDGAGHGSFEFFKKENLNSVFLFLDQMLKPESTS